jgi:hypothetical protein
VTACRLSRQGAAFFAFVLLVSPALAQYGASGPEVQPNNYPPALPTRRGPGPVLVFERLGEIALPGPLGERPGFLSDGVVVLPVEGGWARVVPEAEATPSIVPAVDPPETPEWVPSFNGKRRYRTTAEGLVEAQRRSRTSDKWVRSWRIVAPNSIMAPPILLGPRLCYAGLDDRVTCVRASNGHRVWAVDLGDRLSRELTCWPACGTGAVDGEVLLVVPDDGASLIALDAYDGRRVATFELPAAQRFTSPALVVSGDRIAIARKGYDAREAALVLLRLTTPPPAAPPVPLPYTGGSPAETGPLGRVIRGPEN